MIIDDNALIISRTANRVFTVLQNAFADIVNAYEISVIYTVSARDGVIFGIDIDTDFMPRTDEKAVSVDRKRSSHICAQRLSVLTMSDNTRKKTLNRLG